MRPVLSLLIAAVLPLAAQSGKEDREFSVNTLNRIARPVIESLAEVKLKERLPLTPGEKDRAPWTHLEAFGRTLAGISPWLALGPDDTPEGKLRANYIALSRKELVMATDPASPDRMNFSKGGQPLVDAAFPSQALVCRDKKHELGERWPKVLSRAIRYAEVQERLISPEGTYPVIGRSSAYRFGAFQNLSMMALRKEVAEPAAVRGALTAVIRRTMPAPWTFDKDGWLQVGAVGHQPSIHESYISTGSLYLCLAGLQHLGLPSSDPFWTSPSTPWTQ